MSSPQPQNNDEEARRREAEAAMRHKALMVLLDPDLAAAVENYLISAASTGRLSRALTDEELKRLLINLQQPKKDFKINRI